MKNKNNKASDQSLFEALLEDTALVHAECLDISKSDCVCVIHKEKMTALEVADVITTLSNIASDLTVALASACGFCDNCGDENPINCASCKATKTDWVENCTLYHELLDGSQKIQIPDYVLEDAGIPKGAKLEAFSADDGEIVVTEAEYQKDINDVSPGIISVLVASGICLAALDELIMQEEIIYGE